MPSPSSSPRYRFASPPGYELIKKTLQSQLPFTPHDYQLEGVGQLLDGKDLVAVLATGSGKTGYYLIYMLMLCELSKNPALCQAPYPPAPKDPCMVIIYPTNGLEEEQAAVFGKAGLTTLVINATTLEEGRKAKMDLWAVARTNTAVILLSPELLTSPRFDALLQNPAFQSRFPTIIPSARFPLGTRLLGSTATLLVGHPEKTILSFVGLREGEFYLLRRSNIRCNVQTIFRTLSRGLGGWSFPDIKWILRDGRKTVIHCRTIATSFRVAVYLLHLCPLGSDPTRRGRMYNTYYGYERARDETGETSGSKETR
ncbi:hypothetical protein LXA43DRAFT_1152807 [Ganoderma leucocontextum]|nr:hypothetical protein LXA43DRAFT_1152807 [Ganoderma leucocontextum]